MKACGAFQRWNHNARPGDEADANDALVLVYDAWNRLAESFDDDNADGVPDAAEAIIREYEYDGQGRMISWTLDGCQPIENYYSDAWQIVETRYDYDTNGHAYLQYVWDERYVDAPVVRYQDINMDGDYDDSNDSVLYYTTDANFNVTGLVYTSGAMPAERYAYDPYGNVQIMNFFWIERATFAFDNTRLYAGYEYEEYTGLYHVRNRAYHPTLGRWVQRDPIGYADGMNLYEYVGASPVNNVDPTGMKFNPIEQTFVKGLVRWAIDHKWHVSAEILNHWNMVSSIDTNAKEDVPGLLIKPNSLAGFSIRSVLSDIVINDIRSMVSDNFSCCGKEADFYAFRPYTAYEFTKDVSEDLYWGLHWIEYSWKARLAVKPPNNYGSNGCCQIPYTVSDIVYYMKDRFNFNPGQFKKVLSKQFNDWGGSRGTPFDIQMRVELSGPYADKVYHCESYAPEAVLPGGPIIA